jgi:NADPH-dependent ferric siderophore reductase
MTVTAARPALLAFDVEVVGVRRLGPSMVRVTFGGDCLSRFDDGGALGPRDRRVKLMFPAPGATLPDLSDLSAGWYQRWLALDPAVRGSMRTYTVRAARVVGPEPQIDIDFVLHGADGHAGPGSGWAAQAAVGQRLTVIGPCAGSQAYGGIEWQPPAPLPGSPVRVVLAGDETAVPAIASILETLPPGYAGHALLEVPSADDVVAAEALGPKGGPGFDDGSRPGDGGVEVCWLARDGRPRGELLRAALRELMTERAEATVAVAELADVDVDREILWESPEPSAPAAPGRTSFYAWVAGEAAVVRDLRRLLVRDLGVDRSQVAFMGYWREGRAELT